MLSAPGLMGFVIKIAEIRCAWVKKKHKDVLNRERWLNLQKR